ncbi:hypothetical protein [Chryseobacterium binzhouense]|uniref:hypothetical protein n=1 Tax=Chryseobacterium binzhouense TaxID=2593646 RepID=UPI00117EC6D1|nr:hypothetical protein [Chryseobacterium binzhouense]
MATYESFIKLNGTIGDLVFYNLNGKNIVRRKSGFNKTAYKKSPSYEKVRQNSSEFGHCSKVGKAIRICLAEYIAEAQDALLYQRFAKTMTGIKDSDIASEKGNRTVKAGLKTNSGKSLLQQFQFGNIPAAPQNTQIYLGLWDKNLSFSKETDADEMDIVTIKIDYNNYTSESFKENIKLQENQYEVNFENHFNDEEVLHFVCFRKHGKITKMGFV